jgi:hypothetical protein
MATKPLFQARSTRLDGSPQALVIHCGDHRFQGCFREFLTEHLGLSRYALVAIPGGPHFLPFEHIMPKFANAGMQSISFHVKRARPEKLILVGHEGCVFFKDRLQFFFPEDLLRDKQLANLRKSRAILQERFPSLPVETYYADSSDQGRVGFLSVD